MKSELRPDLKGIKTSGMVNWLAGRRSELRPDLKGIKTQWQVPLFPTLCPN